MSDMMITVLSTLLIVIVLFLVFREINNWYWKINERVELQKRTNFLLEKISSQLGASNIIEEVTIERISTGKVKTMKMNEWLDFKKSKSNLDDYRIIDGSDIS